MSIEKIFEDMNYGSLIESDKEVKAWIQEHQWPFCQSVHGQTYPNKEAIFVPDSYEIFFQIESTEDLSEAVISATAAHQQWSKIPALGRTQLINELAANISKKSNFLATLESLSTGRLLQDVQNCTIPLVIRHFEYFSGWSALLFKEKQHLKPLGVVIVNLSSNSSLLTAVSKIAPAVAAGNSVVVYLKGNEENKLSVNLALFYLAELSEKLSRPSGLLKVVFGKNPLWKLKSFDQKIDSICYSGDVKDGREITKFCAGSGVRLNLFLKYRYAFIIFECGDVDSAVAAVIRTLKLSYEQGSRTTLLIQESVQSKVIKLLKMHFNKLRYGCSLDTCADIGPIAKFMLQEIVENIKEISDDDTTQIKLPKLNVLTFRTAKEAAALINDSVQDIRASIWAENMTLAMELVKTVDASVIWMNSFNEGDPAVENGNRKYSGWGQDGGEQCLYQYLQPTWYHSVYHKLSGNLDPPKDYSPQNVEIVKKAVELAHKSQPGWKALGAIGRSKKLFACLDALVKHPAANETIDDVIIQQLYSWASACDKNYGSVQETNFKGQVLRIFEPLGVIAIVLSSESPLLALASMLFSAISMGNAAVLFYQGENSGVISSLVKQLIASGLPSGIINIIPENGDSILSGICMNNVQAVWQVGSRLSSTLIQYSSGENHIQKTWVNCGSEINWSEGTLNDDVFLHHSRCTKSIWLPLGVTFAN